ncbi:hypothetical protein JDN40_18225, partial [Rhodomicrobium vannielii ATCC 17100]|uniref:hypothetical protein n=1 Tax=Rhodomicrobium vannielii TaxID=1069 RepID=UPI00191811A9
NQPGNSLTTSSGKAKKALPDFATGSNGHLCFWKTLQPIGDPTSRGKWYLSSASRLSRTIVQNFLLAFEAGVAAAFRWPYINPKSMNATLKTPNFLNWGKILDKMRLTVISPSSTTLKVQLFTNSASSLAMTAASSPKHGRKS